MTSTSLVATSAARLIQTHQILKQSEFYLGGDQVLKKVKWVRDRRVDRLVVNDGASSDGSFEMASLSAIVRVDHNDFWMTPDAGYQKPSAVWKDLLDVKPSCVVSAPDLQPVKDEFQQVVANLQHLQDKMQTPGYEMGKAFFTGGHAQTQRFKVRHVLFEVSVGLELLGRQNLKMITQLLDDNGQSPDSDKPDFATANKWPLTHEETHAELQTALMTHHIVPVPAYDIEGKLILPEAYRCALEDGIVEMHFGLSHFAIAGKKGMRSKDVFVGEIDVMRVLVPPRPTSSNVMKKRVVRMHLDPNTPISKKLRIV